MGSYYSIGICVVRYMPYGRAFSRRQMYTPDTQGNDAFLMHEQLLHRVAGMGSEGCIALKLGSVKGGDSALEISQHFHPGKTEAIRTY